MEIIVTTSKVEISEDKNLNQGEVNVHKVHFSFSKEFDGYSKCARFYVLDKKIDMEIDNDGFCDIPYEAIQYQTEIRIGAYGEKVDENNKVHRWSPTPTDKIVLEGTYNGEGTNSEELTPTDKQQMNSKIQKNTDDIADLNSNKQDKLTEGDNITIDENGVISATDTIYDDTEVKEDIQSLETNKVDKVEGKELSTNDFSNSYKSDVDANTSDRHSHSNKSILDNTTASFTTAKETKLEGIETGAQVNEIESISVNGVSKTPVNKNVDIDVPTQLSQLSGDSTHRTVSDTEKSTWNSKVDKEVNNLTNYYTKDEADAKLSSVYKYCGTVNNYSDLPSTNLRVGDVYNIVNADTTHHIKAGDNVAWNGSAWDVQSGDVDFSNYYTKPQVDAELLKKQNAINSDNKVNSDFINDEGSTHKFVSENEKSTWNSKADETDYNEFKAATEETLEEHDDQIRALNGFVFDENWDSKQLTNAINTYYAMQYDPKVYEVRFPNWSKSTTTLGTKGLANANLSCTPATDTTYEVTNYPINFMPIDVNAHVEDDGLRLIDSIIGMKNFKSTGKVNVFSMKRTYWHRLFIEDNDLVYQRTFVPKDGFTIVPQAINKDGSYNMFILRGKYVVGDIDGDLYSSKGLIPAHYLNMNASQHPSEEEFSDGISYTGCIPLFKRQGIYYSAGLMADYMDIYLTFLLMFATKDSQSVIAGNTMNSFQYNVSASESDVHRVVLTNAQAANFDLKSYVSVGDRESNTNNDRVNAYMHNIAYDVQIIGKETVDSDHTALILDHANFNTTSTTWVSSMHERSGYSDYVLGNNGSIGSNTNGKHGAVIDGVEIMVGGYEVAGNAIMNIADSTGKREVYYTNDVSKLSSSYATIQSTYKKSNLSIQPASIAAAGWKYITEYGFDLEDGIAVPTQAGQSGSGSAVGYADGLYVDTSTSGQREFLLLGSLNNGTSAGLSCIPAINGISGGNWYFLARLSINGVGGELTE